MSVLQCMRINQPSGLHRARNLRSSPWLSRLSAPVRRRPTAMSQHTRQHWLQQKRKEGDCGEGSGCFLLPGSLRALSPHVCFPLWGFAGCSSSVLEEDFLVCNFWNRKFSMWDNYCFMIITTTIYWNCLLLSIPIAGSSSSALHCWAGFVKRLPNWSHLVSQSSVTAALWLMWLLGHSAALASCHASHIPGHFP